MCNISILVLQMMSEERKRRVRFLFSFKFDLLRHQTLCLLFLILLWPHLQMNYTFLKQCVKSGPFAPIQQQWLDSIISRIPPKLKERPEANNLLQELCIEISSDFHNAIVKYTGAVL